jgi:pentatricopeptide repeat protein
VKRKKICCLNIILLLLLSAVNSQAVDRPPLVSDKLKVEEATNLSKYLSITAKFKVGDYKIIKDLEADIDKRLAKDSTNPVLWFFKARISALLLSLRNRQMEQNNTTREQRLNDSEYLKYKDESIEGYKRALQLDDRDDVSMHLNVTMLGSIDRYVFSDADMQVKASRKIIGRVKKHPEERTTDIEDWEFKTYGNIVTAYVDEKRYDEALSVLEEMKEKFPYPQSLKEINVAVKRIKERKAAAMQKANTAVNDQAAKSKPQQTRKEDRSQSQKVMPAPFQAPQKLLKPIPMPKVQPSDAGKPPSLSAKIVIILAIMAVVMLGIFLYFRQKRK